LNGTREVKRGEPFDPSRYPRDVGIGGRKDIIELQKMLVIVIERLKSIEQKIDALGRR